MPLSAVTEIKKPPLSKQRPNCSDGCGTDLGDSSAHVQSPQTGVHKVTAVPVFTLVDQRVFTAATYRRMSERSFARSRERSEVATSPENPSLHRWPWEYRFFCSLAAQGLQPPQPFNPFYNVGMDPEESSRL